MKFYSSLNKFCARVEEQWREKKIEFYEQLYCGQGGKKKKAEAQRKSESESMKNSLYSAPYSTETSHNLWRKRKKREASFSLITGNGAIVR